MILRCVGDHIYQEKVHQMTSCMYMYLIRKQLAQNTSVWGKCLERMRWDFSVANRHQNIKNVKINSDRRGYTATESQLFLSK